MSRHETVNGSWFVVDDNDDELVRGRGWRAKRTGKDRVIYVVSGQPGRGTWVALHRLLLGAPEGMVVDHIDGDGLNNRRNNLRLCTHAENLRNRGMYRNNTTGVKGVTWNKGHQKFQAQLRLDGKTKHIGYFESLERARIAVAAARLKIHGEFARQDDFADRPVAV